MKKQPIFRKILMPVICLMMAEVLIFLSVIIGRGLIGELKGNERKVVDEQVISLKSNIETDMFYSWMDLRGTVGRINQITGELLRENQISMEELGEKHELEAELLERLTNPLISSMLNNRVTGAFLILNTEDLEMSMQSGEYHNKQGIYIHNNDPNSKSPDREKSVLMLRSPISVVQNLGIAMDSSWDVNFDFSGKNIAYYDMFYRPFQMAYQNGGKYDWADMGCWSRPYRLDGAAEDAITYSVPLILEDGTLYGVLGIDVTESYLRSKLSGGDLISGGTYFLAQSSSTDDGFYSTFAGNTMNWVGEEDDDKLFVNDSKYYVHEEELNIYDNNTPFENEKWSIVGVVPYSGLYGFANDMEWAIGFAVLLTLIVGVSGSLMISFGLQFPIARLVDEMKKKDTNVYVDLEETGIKEIDELSAEMGRLSRSVLENGKKFSTIMQMSSTWIAGFQIDYDDNSLFVTEHFFSIFGLEDINDRNMSVQEFEESLKRLEQFRIEPEDNQDELLYQIQDDQKTRYVRLKIVEEENSVYGLAEDVTKTLLEKRIITHERDHDALTNIYNRRAFRRIVSELFEKRADELGVAAFIMLDLDNLKVVNDTYGHEYGDRYIIQAAKALQKSVTGPSCYARISGDEFNVFLYGYNTKEEAERQIHKLWGVLCGMQIQLPDGGFKQVQASGGIAWYPQNSKDLETLSQYADHAMYMSKRMGKGEIHEFDLEYYLDQKSQHADKECAE